MTHREGRRPPPPWPRDERRGPARLEPEQAWRLVDRAVRQVLRVAHPVARDVPGVADRPAMDVGCATERIGDLERARLLTLQAVGVDRVYERDRVAFGEPARELERHVEV